MQHLDFFIYLYPLFDLQRAHTLLSRVQSGSRAHISSEDCLFGDVEPSTLLNTICAVAPSPSFAGPKKDKASARDRVDSVVSDV